MEHPEHIRLLTLEVVGAIAAFVVLFRPNSKDQRTADDAVSMQAIELRVEEKGYTRTVCLPIPLTIGRGAHATLVIQDAQVSRMHARVGFFNGKLNVRDLGSRNGTLVNARPIDGPTPVNEGDEIVVGDVHILIGRLLPWT